MPHGVISPCTALCFGLRRVVARNYLYSCRRDSLDTVVNLEKRKAPPAMANGYVVRNHRPLLVDGVDMDKRDLRASCHMLVGCSDNKTTPCARSSSFVSFLKSECFRSAF